MMREGKWFSPSILNLKWDELMSLTKDKIEDIEWESEMDSAEDYWRDYSWEDREMFEEEMNKKVRECNDALGDLLDSEYPTN